MMGICIITNHYAEFAPHLEAFQTMKEEWPPGNPSGQRSSEYWPEAATEELMSQYRYSASAWVVNSMDTGLWVTCPQSLTAMITYDGQH